MFLDPSRHAPTVRETLFVQRKRPVPDHPTGGERGGADRDWHRARDLPEKHSKRYIDEKNLKFF